MSHIHILFIMFIILNITTNRFRGAKTSKHIIYSILMKVFCMRAYAENTRKICRKMRKTCGKARKNCGFKQFFCGRGDLRTEPMRMRYVADANLHTRTWIICPPLSQIPRNVEPNLLPDLGFKSLREQQEHLLLGHFW